MSLRVLEYLKQRGAAVPVIVQSASPLHLPAAQAAGAQAVIGKPFDLQDLLTLVAIYHSPLATLG